MVWVVRWEDAWRDEWIRGYKLCRARSSSCLSELSPRASLHSSRASKGNKARRYRPVARRRVVMGPRRIESNGIERMDGHGSCNNGHLRYQLPRLFSPALSAALFAAIAYHSYSSPDPAQPGAIGRGDWRVGRGHGRYLQIGARRWLDGGKRARELFPNVGWWVG